jgi:hypothetical protein
MTIELTARTSISAERRAAGGSDFADLRRRVEHAGLLRRRPGYYAARFVVVGLALVGGWGAFVGIGDSCRSPSRR